MLGDCCHCACKLSPATNAAPRCTRRLSARGGPGRCFSSALLCRAPAFPSSQGVWATGQFYVDLYKNDGLSAKHKIDFKTAYAEGAAAGAEAAAPPGATVSRLNILFQTRGGDMRQILNLRDILEECSRWRLYNASTNTLHYAACAHAEFPDIPTSVACDLLLLFWGQVGRA